MSQSPPAGQAEAKCPGCGLAKDRNLMIYATLDAQGEMLLTAGCDLVARGSLTGPVSVALDPARAPAINLGGVHGQRYGFHGEIHSIRLMRGVMARTDGPSCSFSLKNMDP